MTTSPTREGVLQQSIKPQQLPRKRQQPMYHVVLLDDDDHTYDYVVGMLRKLFCMTSEEAFTRAFEVDTTKRVILDTTTLERAELKRDQIQSYGRDWRIPRCCGSMSCIIEPTSD